jgi:hypothetical protein
MTRNILHPVVLAAACLWLATLPVSAQVESLTFTFNPGALMSLPPPSESTYDGEARIISRFLSYNEQGFGNLADINHTGNTYTNSVWALPQPLQYNTYQSWLGGLGPGEGIASFNIFLVATDAALAWGQLLTIDPPASGSVMSGSSGGGWDWQILQWGTNNQPGSTADGYFVQWSTTNDALRLRPGVQLPDFSFTAPVQVRTSNGLTAAVAGTDYNITFVANNRPGNPVNFPNALNPSIDYDNQWAATTNAIRGPWANTNTDFWQANTFIKATMPVDYVDATGGVIDSNTATGQAPALAVTSGSNSITTQVAATNIQVAGGTLTVEDSVLNTNTALTVSTDSSVLGLQGTNTVGSFQASAGTTTIGGQLNVTGSNNAVFSGASVSGGPIQVGGTNSSGSLQLANTTNPSAVTSDVILANANSTLSGSGGTTGTVTGGGRIRPGASPGILTVGQLDLSGGVDVDLEFNLLGAPNYADAINSGNDVVRILGPDHFAGTSFDLDNEIVLYFNQTGNFEGGFFLDDSMADIVALISSADIMYYLADSAGTVLYNGQTYSPLSATNVILSNVTVAGASFAGGTTNGTTLGFSVVPEPSTYALVLLGAAAAFLARRRMG